SCDYASLPNWEPVETSCDGLDNDCDGLTDSADSDLANALGLCEHQAGVCSGATRTLDLCVGGVWADCDGVQYGGLYTPDSELACDG
ncbi:MAG: hypothetical protein QF464_06660, partial [Myxococcota bacterium]|nr:hypothetical protein [Myxococcota bacterium]